MIQLSIPSADFLSPPKNIWSTLLYSDSPPPHSHPHVPNFTQGKTGQMAPNEKGNTLPWFALLAPSLISLNTMFMTSRPIERTPGLHGSDKNVSKHQNIRNEGIGAGLTDQHRTSASMTVITLCINTYIVKLFGKICFGHNDSRGGAQFPVEMSLKFWTREDLEGNDKVAAGIKLRQRPRTRWRLLEDMGSTLGPTQPPASPSLRR